MKIVDGTTKNFTKEVLKSKIPVLVDFNAVWCPPCQALHPILEDLAEETDAFKIVLVDIDAEPELAAAYQVSTIPCVVAFRDGEEVDRRIGLQPKRRLIKMMEK